MKSEGKILTFGETLMRLSPENNLRLEQATTFRRAFGGAEANVAVSLAIQGDDAAYASAVPAGRLGDQALREFASWGVDVSRVSRPQGRLGLYFMELGGSERANRTVYDRSYSAFSMAKRGDFDWDKLLEGIDAFYFSGITPAVSDQMALVLGDALSCCQKLGIHVVCDLNYRSSLWTPQKSQDVMRRLMPYVDVCIANDEDARMALGTKHGSDALTNGIDNLDEYRATAREIADEYGCGMVASVVRNVASVEKSSWMGLLYRDGKYWESPVHDVLVREGVGGGDAFGAGLVHALRAQMNPQEAINYAISAAVLKLTIRGDYNLATEQEIMSVAAGSAGSRVIR